MSTPTYNRLENRTRTSDFSKALRAEVRDPLWMLSRQWQMGEFKSENTGSPIKSRVHAALHPIQRFMGKAGGAVREIPNHQPLEVFVERERVPMDLLMRAEMGRHFLRILAKHIPSDRTRDQIIARLLSLTTPVRLRLTLPEKNLDTQALFSNRRLRMAATLLAAGDTFDGGALFDFLQKPGQTFSHLFDQIPANVPVAQVDEIGVEFMAWFRKVYAQPDSAEESSYLDSRGEYEFHLSAANADGQSTVLHAPQYHHGSLDWYAFDHAA
ncbi:MAG: hypothetical protein AAF570_25595, partial [Bacteroidota bacterium]